VSGYLKNISILVVDDCSFTRRVTVRILQCFDAHNIREAFDGDDATEQILTSKPDLLITDWSMSPLNGIALAQWVRKGRDTPDPYLPIIMMSGYSDVNRVKEARDAGINEFLVKPMAPIDLMRRIQVVVEKPRFFIRNDDYFGPDRRRRTIKIQIKDRRQDLDAMMPRNEPDTGRAEESSVLFD
jgi:PleD family two-component response regulator